MKPLRREGGCFPDEGGAVLESACLACARLWIQSRHHNVKQNKASTQAGSLSSGKPKEYCCLLGYWVVGELCM